MVKRFAQFLTVILLASTSLVSAQEATETATKVDPSGTWKWEREFGDNTLSSTLVLDLKEEKLSGTLHTVFSGGNFGGGGPNDPIAIDDAKMEEGNITFSVTRDFGGNDFTIDYACKLEDGKLSGVQSFEGQNGPQEFEFEATRSVSLDDVVGKWNITFEGFNGEEIETSLTLEKDGEKLKGISHSEFFGDTPLSDIEYKDGELTFKVVIENDNGNFEVGYKAETKDDTIEGTITTDFGGQVNETPFEGKLEKKAEEAGEEAEATAAEAAE